MKLRRGYADHMPQEPHAITPHCAPHCASLAAFERERQPTVPSPATTPDPVVADARRGVVIVLDHSSDMLSRQTRRGVCSKNATDEQLRAAVGLAEPSEAGPARVLRTTLADFDIINLQAFTVTGYTGG
jgi:hypothetical protein